MIISLWQDNLCCMSTIFGRAFALRSFENGGEGGYSLIGQFSKASYIYKMMLLIGNTCINHFTSKI